MPEETMKYLPLLLALCICMSGTSRAEPDRIHCYVQQDAISVHCPQADRGWLTHMAWMYPGMFREHVIPANLKPHDLLSCGVNPKEDLADCVVPK